MKRIIGIVMLLVGLLGLVVSVGGTLVSRSVVDRLGSSLDTTLTLAADSLDTVGDTLALTKTSVEQAGSSLDTLALTAGNVSTTIGDTQPLVDKVTTTATQQIPDSIEAIQGALPNVAEAAGAIDDTLRVLDSFALDRQVFGIPLQFDLGIDYQPTESLDDTVLVLGDSLDGLPGELRALESDMLQTSENLALVAGNIDTIGDDLELISQTVAEIDPLLDQYLDIVDQTQTLLAQTQNDLDQQLGMMQLAITALFVWLGLNQLVPLYLGWTLMTGADVTDEEVRQAAEKAVAEAASADGDDQVAGPDKSDEDESEADERS